MALKVGVKPFRLLGTYTMNCWTEFKETFKKYLFVHLQLISFSLKCPLEQTDITQHLRDYNSAIFTNTGLKIDMQHDIHLFIHFF